MSHPRNNDNPTTRDRNLDAAVRSGLHDFGAQSIEKLVACTGTVVWYCGKFTVFCYCGDQFLERMSDTELGEWIVETMKFRIRKGVF